MCGVLYCHAVKTECGKLKINQQKSLKADNLGGCEKYLVFIVVMNTVEFMDAGMNKFFGTLVSEPILTSQRYSVMDLFG